MTKCKECGNEISDKAEACPKCGVKVKKTSLVIKIGGGFVLLMILIAIFGPDQPANTSTAEAETMPAAVPVPAFKTTAADIAAAYDQNTVAADNQYKGKRFEVTGVISEIRTDMMDNAVLELKGNINPYMEPQASLIDSEKAKAAELQKGMKITLSCEGSGDIAKTPMMRNCAIL